MMLGAVGDFLAAAWHTACAGDDANHRFCFAQMRAIFMFAIDLRQPRPRRMQA